MSTANLLDREEYIEQAYFFRTLRERLEGASTQDVLERIDQEVLSTTRLPFAIQFLAGEVKHSGLLSSGFARLGHYFSPFQTFVIRGTEREELRFNLDVALLVLQREAEYRAAKVTRAGLFVYQFEVICRNRLGYDEGLASLAADPYFDGPWQEFLDYLHTQVGIIDLPDLIYLRSDLYVAEKRRHDADYEPSKPPLFDEKEGKIARANIDRDPLYLFAALQRQLGYPKVPRARPRDDVTARLEALQVKLDTLTKRLSLLESEMRGQVDLKQFAKPEMLGDAED